MFIRRTRPLNAFFIEPAVSNARYGRPERSIFLQDLFGRIVVHFISKPLRDLHYDRKVVPCLPGRLDRLAHPLHLSLCVSESTVFLEGTGRRKDHMSKFGRIGHEYILDHEELEALERLYSM